jgi:hypothetical protein
MRDRPFLSASESPRAFSEIKAERAAGDPEHRRRNLVLDEITLLEAEARVTADPAERNRLQLQAEELRCLVYHQYFVPEEIA